MEKVEVSGTMRKVFAFDNKLGYKFGTFMWSGFWLVQILGLATDDSVGTARDYLTLCAVFSLFTFIYFAHTQTRILPASTASIVVMLPECLFRLLLLAHFGFSNVVGEGTIEGINFFTFISSCVFGSMKLFHVVYANFNFKEYKSYEEEVLNAQ